MPRRKPWSNIEDHPKRTEIVDKLMLMLRQRDYGVHPGEERVTLTSISREYCINRRRLGAYTEGPLQEVLESIRNGAAASNLHYDVLAVFKRGIQEIYQSMDDANDIPSLTGVAEKPEDRAKLEQQEHLLRMRQREDVITNLLFPLMEKAGQLLGPMKDRVQPGDPAAPPIVHVNQQFVGGGAQTAPAQPQLPEGNAPGQPLAALPTKTAEAAPVGD